MLVATPQMYNAQDTSGGIQAGQEPAPAVQKVAYTTSTQSTRIQDGTTLVRVVADADALVSAVSAFVSGVVPGMISNVLGTLIASLAIFRRSEASLFREMEAG